MRVQFDDEVVVKSDAEDCTLIVRELGARGDGYHAYLTASQARRLAATLIKAADKHERSRK